MKRSACRSWLDKQIEAFRHDQSGAVSIEYVIIVGIMAVAIVTSLVLFQDPFSEVTTAVAGAIDPGSQ